MAQIRGCLERDTIVAARLECGPHPKSDELSEGRHLRLVTVHELIEGDYDEHIGCKGPDDVYKTSPGVFYTP